MKFMFSKISMVFLLLSFNVQAGLWGDIKRGIKKLDFKQPEATSTSLVQVPFKEILVETKHPDAGVLWSSSTTSPPRMVVDQTITDTSTGLTWLRCAHGQNWIDDSCDGVASSHSWDEAIRLKIKYGGFDDWRLPSIMELQTFPAKDSEDIKLFYSPNRMFWSSSAYADGSKYAYVYAADASFNIGDRKAAWHVRFVRGGNSSLLKAGQNLIVDRRLIESFINNRQWQYGLKNTIQGNFAELVEKNIILAEKMHLELPRHLKEYKFSLIPPSLPSKIVKDEFETTAEFNLRVSKTQADYEAAVENYNQRLVNYENKIKLYYNNLDPLPENVRHEAIRSAFVKSFGPPLIKNVKYDADVRSFYAEVSAQGNSAFKKSVVLRDIHPDRARILKPSLERAKVEVVFRINPDNNLAWDFVNLHTENQILLASPVNVEGESQQLEASFRPAELAKPNIDVPLPIGLNGIEFAIRDDPSVIAKQAEIERTKRQQAHAIATVAKLKQLEEEHARLKQANRSGFNDDLQVRLTAASPAKLDKNLHVLAIGIGDYADVADVPYADRSAEIFGELARKTLGASEENIIILTNHKATSGSMRARLRQLLGRLTSKDRLIIYFAGHGVPARDGTESYLLAHDGGPGLYEEPDLQLNALYSQVNRSSVGKAHLFIDACFSGRSGKDNLIFEGIGGVVIVPKHGMRSDGRLTVITAGRADQFSNQEKARGHRLYSYHLMHALLDSGGMISADKLHSVVRDKVLNDSLRLGPEFAQEPELLGNPMAILKY